jgi:hypothetical protein
MSFEILFEAKVGEWERWTSELKLERPCARCNANGFLEGKSIESVYGTISLM